MSSPLPKVVDATVRSGFDLGKFEVALETIAANASRNDRDRILPHAETRLVRESGFPAVRLPVSVGGGGASLREVLALAIRLGEADSNVAQIFRNHFVFVERCLIGHLDDPRRKAWIDDVVDGSIASLAATEITRRQTGGTSAFETVLRPQDGAYRLKGSKFYTTGALHADWLFVRASTPEGTGISVVLPTRREGLERVDDWNGMGQRLTGTGTTNFHDVLVHEHEILRDGDLHPLAIAFTSTLAQLFLTAVNVGVARAAVREAVGLVSGRGRTFYYAPAERAVDDPILQEQLGHISANAFAGEHVVLGAAAALDRAAEVIASGADAAGACHQAALEAAKAKIVVDPIAIGAGSALYELGGASATLRDRNFDRHWRNARTLASHNPASYKAAAVGAYEIAGKELPRFGFF